MVCEAERAVTGPGVDRVPGAVGLEGGSGAVVAPGVGLDDQALGFEEEVDLAAGGSVVDPGRREVVVGADGQEQALEAALGAIGARLVGLEGGPQLRGSTMARAGPGQGMRAG